MLQDGAFKHLHPYSGHRWVVERVHQRHAVRHQLVEQRKREHAAEAVHALAAPFFVGMNDRFGVALGPVTVALRLECRTNVRVVVDLSVVRHPHSAVFVRERLVAASEIDDAETSVSQQGVRVGVQPGTVGTAVGQNVAHPQRPRDVFVMQRVGGDDSSYTAHGLSVEQSECHETQ